jgi:RNA polymerase sporulation-specific sigma factor
MGRAGEIAYEIETYLPVVMGEARRLSGSDPFTMEDLAQEGLIAALHALDTYDPARGNIEGYVRACARNRMISYLRRGWHESVVNDELLDARASDAEDSAASFEGPQERIEISEALAKLIDGLSAFEQSVLHAYLQAGSLSDTAVLLKCDRKRVDNALQRIRNKARAQ